MMGLCIHHQWLCVTDRILHFPISHDCTLFLSKGVIFIGWFAGLHECISECFMMPHSPNADPKNCSIEKLSSKECRCIQAATTIHDPITTSCIHTARYYFCN